MSWGDSLVRSLVQSVDSLVEGAGFMEKVTLERWAGQSDTVTPVTAAPLVLKCVVERRSRMVRLRNGEEVMSRAKVTYTKPIKKLSPVVEGRIEPIDPRDVITLADGTTGPILDVDSGITDPVTARGYVNEVYLG